MIKQQLQVTNLAASLEISRAGNQAIANRVIQLANQTEKN